MRQLANISELVNLAFVHEAGKAEESNTLIHKLDNLKKQVNLLTISLH